MDTCDCDALHTQIEMSTEQSEIQSDIEKRSAMSFERSLLKPAFFQPRSAPVHSTWSFKKPVAEDNSEWKPKFLQFCKQSCRMKSFSTWPKQMNPRPEQLARVGFFYEGVSDTCRCFFCGVIVHNWESKDDAFEEHMKHSPNCHFIEFQK